jgi:hypothetical protein
MTTVQDADCNGTRTNHDDGSGDDANDDQSSSDNDSLMQADMNIPLDVVESFSTTPGKQCGRVPPTTATLSQLNPAQSMNLVDTAILDCFHLAVCTHDTDKLEQAQQPEMDWKAPPLHEDDIESEDEFLKKWIPSCALALPIWAVGPSSTAATTIN